MLARKVIFVKIKKVSELTGLTARAIRVYIDEELIAPNFTENYLGRRSFDFTQDDIKALKNIATLRKYGFSIDEIRNILLDSHYIVNLLWLHTKACREHFRKNIYITFFEFFSYC